MAGYVVVGLLVLACLGSVPGGQPLQMLTGLGLAAWVGARVWTGQCRSELTAVQLLTGLDVAAAAEFGGCSGCGDRLPEAVVAQVFCEEPWCLPCIDAWEPGHDVPLRPATRGDRLIGWAYSTGSLPFRRRCRAAEWYGHTAGASIVGCLACRQFRAIEPWWIVADALDLPTAQARLAYYEDLVTRIPSVQEVAAGG